jgi:ABC-type multidrug transport system ATPase subunit
VEEMIELEKVFFSYNEDFVLRDVSLKIDSGITLFRGPNGSGKTTLAKIISGLLPPKRGRVTVDGVNIYQGDVKAKNKLREIVYVHDSPVVLKGDVYRNLTYGLRIMGLTAQDKLLELIRSFNIGGILRKDAYSLSAGERQIVSLVRALAVDPLYLILDEPLQYLDDERRGKVINYLRILRGQGKTILIATHERDLLEYADKIYYIRYGSIEEIIV